MRRKILVLLVSALLTACAGTDVKHAELVACAGDGLIEVSIAAASGGYVWKGQLLTATELASAIKAEAKACPVSEIRLLRGQVDMSIANAIEIGRLASDVGAQATYQDASGAIKSIIFVQ